MLMIWVLYEETLTLKTCCYSIDFKLSKPIARIHFPRARTEAYKGKRKGDKKGQLRAATVKHFTAPEDRQLVQFQGCTASRDGFYH